MTLAISLSEISIFRTSCLLKLIPYNRKEAQASLGKADRNMNFNCDIWLDTTEIFDKLQGGILEDIWDNCFSYYSGSMH